MSWKSRDPYLEYENCIFRLISEYEDGLMLRDNTLSKSIPKAFWTVGTSWYKFVLLRVKLSGKMHELFYIYAKACR